MFYIQFLNIFFEKISKSLISSFLVSYVSESLRSAHQKWAMWANCSGHSTKMSNHERFAQVAQRNWAIVSKSLKLLNKNERMSESLIFFGANRSFDHFWAKNERFAQKSDERIPSPVWSWSVLRVYEIVCWFAYVSDVGPWKHGR